jgi:hypothetical protein
MSACQTCIERQANLGDPSEARWIGPDGNEYCSLHLIQAFGHGEPLIRVEDYTPPVTRKAPAPKKPAEPKARPVTEVKS